MITIDSMTTKTDCGRKNEAKIPIPKESNDRPSTLQKFFVFISNTSMKGNAKCLSITVYSALMFFAIVFQKLFFLSEINYKYAYIRGVHSADTGRLSYIQGAYLLELLRRFNTQAL